MLYSLKKEAGHDRTKDKSTSEKSYEIIPIPCPGSSIITIKWTQNSWYK